MTKNVNKENKNVNKVNNVKENKGDNTMNNKTTAIINDTIKSVIASITREDMTPVCAIEQLFDNTIRGESNARLARARLYYSIQNSAQIRSMIEFKSMEDFINAHNYEDSKSTASEMCKVYSLFFADTTEKIALYRERAYLTYTEMVKISSVGKGTKTIEEKCKEIELFLDKYIIEDVKQWNTVSQLRDILYCYVNGIDVNTMNKDKANKADKADKADKGNTDYTSVKSLADTTAKEANSKIKALKEAGDFVENKAKNTITITAKSVNDFMNALVALAKKQGVKPMSFTGEIVFTISGHK